MKQNTNITTFEELYNECVNSSQNHMGSSTKRGLITQKYR